MTDTLLLTFQSKTVVLTGQFSSLKPRFEKEIADAGAKVNRNVSSSTEVLIVGMQPGQAAMASARSVGAMILTEDQARAVLRGERVKGEEILQKTEGFLPLHDLLGTARSLVARPVSLAVWRDIVELFERCRVEEHEPLTDYIATHSDKWTVHQMQGLLGYAVLERRLTTGQRSGPQHYVEHELRVAPVEWVDEIAREEHSPKHALAHALDLRAVKLSATKTRALLQAASLPHLERLHLEQKGKLDHKTLSLLLTHENFCRLRYLSLASIATNALNHLPPPSNGQSIETLDISATSASDEETMDALARSLFVHSMKRLILYTSSTSDVDSIQAFLTTLAQHANQCAPQLHTLQLNRHSTWSARNFRAIVETGIFSCITCFAINWIYVKYLTSYNREEFFSIELPDNITCIKLHFVPGMADSELLEDLMKYGFLREFLEAPLTQTITHLELGELWMEERAQQIAREVRPELHITSFGVT